MENTTHEVTFTHGTREIAIADLKDGEMIRVSLARRKFVEGCAEPFDSIETYILLLKGKGIQLQRI